MNVERTISAEWRKSSHSSDQGGACIEVANSPDTIHVRDSKNTDGPRLAFPPHQWTAFLTYTIEG